MMMNTLTEDRRRRIIREVEPIRHRIASEYKHWTLIEKRQDGISYRHSIAQGLTAIFSVEYHGGMCWLHASIARIDKIPDYKDLCKLKKEFIGPNLAALMKLPKESEHVNIHPYTLHLFSCLDGDILPDFTDGSGSL